MSKSAVRRAERKSPNHRSRASQQLAETQKSSPIPRVVKEAAGANALRASKKSCDAPLQGSLVEKLKLPRVGRDLNSLQGLLHEMQTLYRAARRRQLDSAEASRLVWIISEAAKIARHLQEQRDIEKLQAQLAGLQGRQPNALHWTPPAPAGDEDEANRVIEHGVLNGGGS